MFVTKAVISWLNFNVERSSFVLWLWCKTEIRAAFVFLFFAFICLRKNKEESWNVCAAFMTPHNEDLSVVGHSLWRWFSPSTRSWTPCRQSVLAWRRPDGAKAMVSIQVSSKLQNHKILVFLLPGLKGINYAEVSWSGVHFRSCRVTTLQVWAVSL